MAWRKPANIGEWLKILSRHHRKAILPALLVAILIVAGSYKVPRVYYAEAKFRRVNDTTIETMGSNIMARNLAPIRRAVVEDIKGRNSIEQIVEDLGLTKDMPHATDGTLTGEGQLQKLDLVSNLQSRISIRYEIRSDQMDDIIIGYSDSDRSLPPRVANQIVENYIRKTRAQLDEMLLAAKTFFERETERYKAREQELTNKKLAFERDNPGLTPDDPGSVNTKRIEVNASLTRITQELEVSRAQRIKLEEWIKSQPEMIERVQRGQNPILTQLLARRSDMERELEAMVTVKGMTPEHPTVKKSQQQLAAIDQKISETEAEVPLSKEQVPNEQRVTAQRDLQSLEGTVTALTRQKDELAAQLDQLELLNRNFFAVRNEYVGLERNLAEAQEQYKFWDDKLKKTQIALTAAVGAQGVRLQFINRADDIARPSRPTFMMIVAIAGAAAAGVAAGVIILFELLDHSIRSIDQAVDDLKLPVLGAVTEIVSPAAALRRKVMHWGVYPALSAAMLVALAVVTWAIYLNLEEPHRFDQLVHRPRQYVKTVIGQSND